MPATKHVVPGRLYHVGELILVDVAVVRRPRQDFVRIYTMSFRRTWWRDHFVSHLGNLFDRQGDQPSAPEEVSGAAESSRTTVSMSFVREVP